MELIYGMDPLCGWCFGIGPALRRVMADHPNVRVTPVLGGLVTGARVGAYAEMEAYIRSAAVRLRAVTGCAPSDAFFDMIRRPGVMGNSGPPSVAIAAVRAAFPDRVADFALRVTEAHFTDGADLNQPETYARVLTGMSLSLTLPSLDDASLAQAEWQHGRAMGLTSFPTLWIRRGGDIQALPLEYDPARLSLMVGGLSRA
jgi:putative protein-disulfide isomerase